MIRSHKKSHEDVLKLAKFLVRFNILWKNTYNPTSEVKPLTINIHEKNKECSFEQQKTSVDENLEISGNGSVSSSDDQEEDDIETGQTCYKNGLSDIDDTPLIMAAKRRCIEIVEEILDLYPQAIEYLNHEGQNVSLVVVKNRNLNVFELVSKKNLGLRSSLRVIDCNGNSILHMVGSNKEVSAGAKLKTPVLQLSEDLLLLEELKTKCPMFLINHRNNQMKTVDELLALNNEKLRLHAKEWLQ